MDNRPIGIFDSGVGGLTVFSELIKALPNEDMIYLGDTKQFPYGNKSRDTIIELTKKNTEFLINKGVKAVVIACGTATSQALDSVYKLYDVPVIGIIEPTVLSLNEEKPKTIGIMATTGTIRSKTWQLEIKKLMPNAEIISQACPLLAQMAEEGWTENDVAKLTIKEYVKAFKTKPVEKLILGCTHYPLFKKLIEEELGTNTEIIDTGKKVGSYLEKCLKETKKETANKSKPVYEFYLTDMESQFLKVANNILQEEIQIKKAKIRI